MKRKLLLVVAALAGCGVMLVSCSQSPEQNPVIQEKFQKVADLSEEVDQLRAKMKDIQNDIDTIHQDLMTLKQMPRAAEISGAEVEGVKTQITQLNGEISALQNELSKLKSSGTTTSSARKTETTTTAAKTSTPVREEVSVRQAGQYYVIQSGDTLKKIADKFSTTADAIRKANKIPEGKEPFTGQKIFVPSR
ncbi:LysM peptidoglycan-binding domain-containing protein [Candidatus Sumerlaeota bacterium]|nr:LysM peptidoglycan-binding domain-containing protein [Candidatus Sumerlaeota bacterium]